MPKITREAPHVSALSVFQEDATTIMYASTWPGVGKTDWCIKQLATRIKARSGITFYVAPTTALLEEVRASLIKNLDRSDELFLHVVIANSDNPLSVAERIDAVINGTDADGLGGISLPCKEGTVLLITHEGFRNLPHSPSSPFRRRDQISVIFDEARKCIVKQLRIKIPDKMTKVLLSDYITLSEGKGAYSRLQVIKSVNSKKFDLAFNENSQMRKTRDLLKNNILNQANTGALQVYVKWGEHSVDGKGTQVTDLHTVLIPHQLFTGWKGVVLLGAFLEDSQMFGLLKTRDVSDKAYGETKPEYLDRVRRLFSLTKTNYVILKDITDLVADKKRLEKIRNRYKQTTICYLSENTSFAQRHLTQGMMVDPYLTHPDNKAFAEAYVKKFHSLRRLVPATKGGVKLTYQNAARIPIKATTSQAAAQLKKHILTAPGIVTEKNRAPLQWYVAKAIEVSEAWYKLQDKPNKILPISLNIGCTSAGLGHAHPQSYWNRLVNIPEVGKGKVAPIPFQSHGLNKYQKLDTIAYLASVNPTPEVRQLLETICVGYDADKDNTLESCIQAITRSSVRDVNSKSKPLLIVTDRKLATLVQQQMMMEPRLISAADLGIEIKDPYYVPSLSSADLLKLKRESSGYKEKEKSTRPSLAKNAELRAFIKANSKYAKRINTLEATVSRLKRTNDPRVKETAAKLVPLRALAKDERAKLVETYKKTKQ